MLTMTHGRLTIALLSALFMASAGADHFMSVSAEAAPPTVRGLSGFDRSERIEAPKTELVLAGFQKESFAGDLKLPDASAAPGNAAQPKSGSSAAEWTVLGPSKGK